MIECILPNGIQDITGGVEENDGPIPGKSLFGEIGGRLGMIDAKSVLGLWMFDRRNAEWNGSVPESRCIAEHEGSRRRGVKSRNKRRKESGRN